MKKSKWLKFQEWFAQILLHLGIINRVVWDGKYPNKIFMYRKEL